MAGISKKQAVFVQEYLVDLNATQAAIRAGYSKRTADRIGPELLGKTCVSHAVQKAMKQREKRTEVTQDKVLEQYARLAFFDIRKLYDDNGNLKPVRDWDDESAAAVAGVETVELLGKEGESICQSVRKIKLTDRRAALADIGKHLGMFKERVVYGGDPDAPIRHEHGASPAVEEIFRRMAGHDQG